MAMREPLSYSLSLSKTMGTRSGGSATGLPSTGIRKIVHPGFACAAEKKTEEQLFRFRHDGQRDRVLRPIPGSVQPLPLQCREGKARRIPVFVEQRAT